MMAQILGMVVYEFRMQWRRRTLVVATITLLALVTMYLLIGGEQLEIVATTSAGLVNVAPWLWVGIYFVIIGVFMPVASENVPTDRQFGMRDLLFSLPLERGVYLVGKLLGLYAAVSVGLMVALLVGAALTHVLIGSLDLQAYLSMWAGGALALALLNTGLSLLLGATQPTRRRAAIIAIGLTVFCFFGFAAGIQGGVTGSSLTLLDMLHPARPALLRYFMPAAPDPNGAAVGVSTTEDAAFTVFIGAAQLILLGVALWAWQRWQGDRA